MQLTYRQRNMLQWCNCSECGAYKTVPCKVMQRLSSSFTWSNTFTLLKQLPLCIVYMQIDLWLLLGYVNRLIYLKQPLHVLYTLMQNTLCWCVAPVVQSVSTTCVTVTCREILRL
ncbi:hypothetical protein NL108_004080 [Boleophthalmus pectinirostris]|nr:hypothetical protein NL108_004080 [Boleophthalmus pectinirostris]